MLNLKSLLGIAATLAILAPAAAFADDDCDRDDHRHYDRHGDDDRRYHSARPASRPGGHYEARTVQQWVEGRWVQDYVPESCQHIYKGRHHKYKKTVCTPARYVDRYVEGHYENVQQWVWVADPQPEYRYGRGGYRTVPDAQVTVNGGNWHASARF